MPQKLRADLMRLQMKIINTLRKKRRCREACPFCIGNEPKSGLARDLGDCLQSRNVPFGTSGDYVRRLRPIFAVRFRTSVKLSCEVQDGSFIFGNGHFIVVLKSGMK